jgi:hypothetical protein
LDAPSKFASHAVANFIDALTRNATDLQSLSVTISSDILAENECGWNIMPSYHPIARAVERMLRMRPFENAVPHLVLRVQDGAKFADGWAQDLEDLFYAVSGQPSRSISFQFACSCPAFEQSGAPDGNGGFLSGMTWQACKVCRVPEFISTQAGYQRIHLKQSHEVEATRLHTLAELLRLEKYERDGDEMAEDIRAAFEAPSDEEGWFQE